MWSVEDICLIDFIFSVCLISDIVPTFTDELFKTLDEICQDMSIVLVEQHVPRALEICDRGFVIEKGKVSIEGDREELQNNEHIKEVYLGIS